MSLISDECEMVEVDVPSAIEARTTTKKPKLIVSIGRGRTGKSTFIRWAAENAIRRGEPVVAGDADRNNATLAAFIEDVSRPEYADDESITEWMNGVIEQQASGGFSFFLDLTGGDVLLKEYAKTLDLVEFCDQIGIDPVAVHFLGSSEDDLAILHDIEQTRVFAPKHTILVLNEGILPSGKVAARAFTPIIDHPIFKTALSRGAKAVIMPRLGCMPYLDQRRLQFEDAVAGRVRCGEEPVGLVNRQLVKMWLRDMDKAFADVRGWLP